MRISKFTKSQIMSSLRAGVAGLPLETVSHQHGISKSSFYNWLVKYSVMDISCRSCLREF